MATAFNMDVNALEKQLQYLIAEGKVAARIDSHAKVLYARHTNERAQTFEKVRMRASAPNDANCRMGSAHTFSWCCAMSPVDLQSAVELCSSRALVSDRLWLLALGSHVMRDRFCFA
jgi:hypothetical protein